MSRRDFEDFVSNVLGQVDSNDKDRRAQRSRNRKAEIRKQRIAALIFDAAESWLRGLEADFELPELSVLDVEPHPMADQFLVVVQAADKATEVASWRDFLQERVGVLRSIVAGQLQGKGAPMIMVEVVSQEEVQDEAE